MGHHPLVYKVPWWSLGLSTFKYNTSYFTRIGEFLRIRSFSKKKKKVHIYCSFVGIWLEFWLVYSQFALWGLSGSSFLFCFFFWTEVASVEPLWREQDQLLVKPSHGCAWVLSLIKLFVSQCRRVPELGHQPELQPCQSIQYTQYPLSPWVSASRLARMIAGWQGWAGLARFHNSHHAEARMSVQRRKKGKKNCTQCYSSLKKWYIITAL